MSYIEYKMGTRIQTHKKKNYTNEKKKIFVQLDEMKGQID